MTVEQIERARKFFDVVSVQNRYNLADREWENVLDYCDRENIGFIPWFPLQTGKLAENGGPLARIAERHHATPAQIALAWLLKRSKVMLPIPGTSKVKHLEENIGGAGIELTDEEFAAIGAEARRRRRNRRCRFPANTRRRRPEASVADEAFENFGAVAEVIGGCANVRATASRISVV